MMHYIIVTVLTVIVVAECREAKNIFAALIAIVCGHAWLYKMKCYVH